MTLRLRIYVLMIAFIGVGGLSERVGAQSDNLVGMLASQLNVSEKQASGGAGSLLNYAKGEMSPADWGVVSEALPDVTSLVGAAPSGGSGVLGSSSSLLSGASSGLGGAANVAGAFTDLGMSPEMVNQFVPVILEYAQSAGNEQVMQLLQSAFTAL